MESDIGFQAALEEARKGASEGGVPIGACLVSGRGHNLRMQEGSPTIHYMMLRSAQGEIAALNNAGRLPASAYQGATMYTTLSPCDMCTGACILYKVKRVVLGENNTFVGGEDYLKQRGIEVVNVKSAECEDLMKKFIKEHPEEWNEDIGEQ
ncbi:cytosine deaminase [Aureobasidium sp. EXF-12298]|nr:cytosine deaminase [Aureobasidium sp. EXF-12298]KAI4761601.1 cytosine deaminase [Aureobasidium sp. EXF-12344]KAI4778888.1 cytosine deaminase [Aureobasidium sp. EXF-3400]